MGDVLGTRMGTRQLCLTAHVVREACKRVRAGGLAFICVHLRYLRMVHRDLISVVGDRSLKIFSTLHCKSSEGCQSRHR